MYQLAGGRLRELLAANPQNLTRPDQFQKSPPVPALKRLAEIKAPTLILTGDADIPDVHAHCGAIQAGIAGSQRIVVKGAGHLLYIERPEEFNRIVSEFVSKAK